jgi:hypothetical protein
MTDAENADALREWRAKQWWRRFDDRTYFDWIVLVSR